MMSDRVAVAMSVYKSDSSRFFTLAIDSILSQNVSFLSVFVEVDGSVSQELRDTLISYNNLPNVYIEFHDQNMGLASRLNSIIDKVISDGTYSFVARMDSDDISSLSRFEKQINFLNSNPDISVVGSDVIEITDSGDEVYYKKMDCTHADIYENFIKKCPFNHPSVMFRASIFDEGFRYKPELMNTQDYYLWVDLLAAGKKFSNINEPLLKFRVNENFHSRRGFYKAINDVKSRVYAFQKLDVLNFSNLLHVFKLFLLRIAPSGLKKWAYRNFR